MTYNAAKALLELLKQYRGKLVRYAYEARLRYHREHPLKDVA